MLWLNPSDGAIIDAPKRPSPNFVVAVHAELGDTTVESTMGGIYRAMIQNDSHPSRMGDIEVVKDIGLNIYADEEWWKKQIAKDKFPYVVAKIASDGTLEIRYNKKATDDKSRDPIKSKEIGKEDEDIFKRGGGGRGRSGQGEPGIPGENGEPSDDEPDDEPEPEPEPFIEPEPDDRDAYKEGQENADNVSDELKEEFKKAMQGPPSQNGEPSDSQTPSDEPQEGEPAEESGPSSGPAEKGGAPSTDHTGETGEGEEGEGEGEGEGDGEGDGEGEGEGDSEEGSGTPAPCEKCGESGEECVCDAPSEDAEPLPTEDPGEATGDELGLPPAEEDALDQCVEEAEDGRDKSEEAAQSADTETAQEGANEARDAADEAKEIVERNDEAADENEKVQQAEEYADEAEAYAEMAEELEEEIQELFEDSGLDEEDYEEFKEGLLDELFGEDSEFEEEQKEREKRLQEKLRLREKNRIERSKVRCVNWETGEIRSFSQKETIGEKWIPITSYFSPFEDANGAQIVVDRTIKGAVAMAEYLGIPIAYQDATTANFATEDAEFLSALKNMRMFTVNTKLGGIHIKY